MQACVNRTQVCVNLTQACVNLTQVVVTAVTVLERRRALLQTSGTASVDFQVRVAPLDCNDPY
jgi:hypothetical protein